MTVHGLLFAACLALALTGANARAKDAERTEVRAESGSSGTTSDGIRLVSRVFPRVSRTFAASVSRDAR